MRTISLVAGAAFLAGRLLEFPPLAAGALALPAVLLFPAVPVLALCGIGPGAARDRLVAPALAPLVLGLLVTVALFAGRDPGPALAGMVILGCAVRLVERGTPDDDPAPAWTWLVGLFFLVVVAAVLVPSPFRRTALDATFHTAVVHEIARAGLPPEDPYFALMPLQYFWFFHAALLGLGRLLYIAPPESMALLNILAAGLSVPATARVVRALGGGWAAGTWAAVFLLLGMGGLFWAFLPVKMLRLFMGEVRGGEELGYVFRLQPFDVPTVAGFTQVLKSTSFLLRKFLVGTAVTWSLLLALLALDTALRAVTGGPRRAWITLFLLAAGAVLFHVVVGGVAVAAVAAGGGLVFLWGPARTRGLAVALVVAAAVAACLPYLAGVTRVKEESNLLPVGFDLFGVLSHPVTLGGVLLLSLPAWPRLAREVSPAARLFLGTTAACLLYALFARLPGPNQYDKPPILAHVPLSVAAGYALPGLWERAAGWRRGRLLLGLFLVLFLVPVNTLRLAAFVVEDGPPPPTAAQRALWSWIGSSTEPDAVFLDSADRVEILLHGPRRQWWGVEFYADQWGYPVEEMNARRALRDAVFGDECVDAAALAPLRRLDVPAYVVAREEDAPGTAACLETLPGIADPVWETGGIRVYRLRPAAAPAP